MIFNRAINLAAKGGSLKRSQIHSIQIFHLCSFNSLYLSTINVKTVLEEGVGKTA